MPITIYDVNGNPRSYSPVPHVCGAGGHTGGSGISRYYVAGMGGATALTTGAPTANVLRAFPLRCPLRRGTIDLLAFNVTTLLAGNARIGAYRNADAAGQNLYPGALIADSGSISTGTAGVKTYATSISFSPGELLWLAYCSDAAATLRALAVAGCETDTLGLDTGMGTAPGIGYSVAHTYGALPATFTAGGAVISAVPLPALAARFSA